MKENNDDSLNLSEDVVTGVLEQIMDKCPDIPARATKRQKDLLRRLGIKPIGVISRKVASALIDYGLNRRR